jgi:hypothetical protein
LANFEFAAGGGSLRHKRTALGTFGS